MDALNEIQHRNAILQSQIPCAGFPLYFDIEIQGLFKDFQEPSSCIFKDQFSTEVYSMDSITAIFNVYFCDEGTVLLDKKLNMTIISKCSFRQHTWQIERPCRQET